MNFQIYQEKFKLRINQELTQFFEHILSELTPSSIEYEFARILQEYTMRGGKRTRPALMYNFYLLLTDNKEAEDILKLSIFFELLQSSLLIHDDIIDRDDLRRGGKTVHKTYEALSEKFHIKNSEHFGNSIAILVGDYAVQLAYRSIADATIKEGNKLKVIDVVSKLTSEIIHGHLYDIVFSQKVDITLNEVIKAYERKTVKYAFELPTLVASAITDQNSDIISILKDYSHFAGIAFQMREDVITLFGNTQKTGKSDYCDIKEGKRTVLYFKAMEAASKEQKRLLMKYYGNSNIDSTQAEEIKQIFYDTGAYTSVKTEINSYVNKALESIGKINKDKENKGFIYINEFTKLLSLE